MSLTFLKNNILPAAFNKEDSIFVDCEVNKECISQDQFQSNIVFLTVKVQNKENIQNIPLVVKFEPSSDLIRTELKTNLQFHNEVLMYSNIFPLLDKHNRCEDCFPKCYYGFSTIVNPAKDVLLLEDLGPRGYRLAEERSFLDLKHLTVALKKLGSFHALSYLAKHQSPDKFYTSVNNLRETRWLEEVKRPLSVSNACFHRAVDSLLERGKHVEKLTSIISRLDSDIIKLFSELLAPEEPWAVVCHGDFCRNNMLFKYDQSIPVDVRFFDVASARYTSPAVDIALLLLMNSSRELRSHHWDNLLRVYHEALSTAATGVPIPSLDVVQEEMRKKTLNGFIHCCYFLPLILYEENIDMESMMDRPPEQVARCFAELGGCRGTKLLIEIAEELLDRDCLNA